MHVYFSFFRTICIVNLLAIYFGCHAAEPMETKAPRAVGTSSPEQIQRLARLLAPACKLLADPSERFGIRCLAFSPDGKTLACGSTSRTVRLWNPGTGKLIHKLKIPFDLEGRGGWDSDTKVCIAFSPDGSTLASSFEDHAVRLWNPSTGKLLKHAVTDPFCIIVGFAFSPDGRLLAYVSLWDKSIRLKELMETHLPTYELNGHSDNVNCVAFSPDGSTLASGSADKTIRLWNLSNGKPTHTLNGHSKEVKCVAFSPDGRLLASGSADKTIRLWNLSNGKPTHTLNGHSESVGCVAFSPNGSTLASGSFDKTVRLWDLSNGNLTHTLNGHSNWANCIAFSPDGTTLASGSWQTVRLWDLKTANAQDFEQIYSSLPEKGREFLGHIAANIERGRKTFIAAGSGQGCIFNTLPERIREQFRQHTEVLELEADWQCSICLEGIAYDHIAKKACNHIFHEKCIDRWQEGGGKLCPLCQRELVLTMDQQ